MATMPDFEFKIKIPDKVQGSFSPLSSAEVVDTVRTLRELDGMTQADFAEKLGISKSALSRIECGEQDPSLPLAMKMLSVFEGEFIMHLKMSCTLE